MEKIVRYAILFFLLSLLWACANDSDKPLTPDAPALPDSVPDYPQPKVLENADNFENAGMMVFDKANYEWVDGHILTDWKMLSRVIYEDRVMPVPDMDKEVLESYSVLPGDSIVAMFPIFHDEIKVLEGKPIQIKGYLIPVEGEDSGKLHFLSANPNSSCFFCGGAGPESVMDVKTRRPHKDLKMDEILTFRGRLRLNDTDLNFLNYILEDAELVGRE